MAKVILLLIDRGFVGQVFTQLACICFYGRSLRSRNIKIRPKSVLHTNTIAGCRVRLVTYLFIFGGSCDAKFRSNGGPVDESRRLPLRESTITFWVITVLSPIYFPIQYSHRSAEITFGFTFH